MALDHDQSSVSFTATSGGTQNIVLTNNDPQNVSLEYVEFTPGNTNQNKTGLTDSRVKGAFSVNATTADGYSTQTVTIAPGATVTVTVTCAAGKPAQSSVLRYAYNGYGQLNVVEIPVASS